MKKIQRMKKGESRLGKEDAPRTSVSLLLRTGFYSMPTTARVCLSSKTDL